MRIKQLSSLILTIILILGVVTTSSATQNRRNPSKTNTGIKIGVGTAIGAGIGALIGGKRGATAGALIGGGGMVAHSLARRDAGYGRQTRKVSTIAAGTLVGTGVGAAIGGGKGAGIGALVGGGSSAIYAFTRKDLKKPEYSSRRVERSTNYPANYPQTQNRYQGDLTTAAAPQIDTNNDPYQRLSGPQGALVGHLAANGSNSIY